MVVNEQQAERMQQLEEDNERLRAENERLKQDIAKLRNALRVRMDHPMATRLRDALRE
ncbi:hypothetical protein [Paenibacillus sp. GCM10027626]|uniref:hypothetical protein n=1 Tax=Paenibacillus sp. GCM10027626 TaxID=3273411 RepID=UPI0036329505